MRRGGGGSDTLEGRTVAVQGLGKVGTHTAEQLVREGAHRFVSDLHDEALERGKKLGAVIVSPEDIYDVECDIFSPRALGGVLNRDTIPRLKAQIASGGANQLLSAQDGDALHDRGILYAPDYVASSGGVIALHHEVYGNFRPELVPDLAQRVGEIMRQVITLSREHQIPTHLAADRIAEERMSSVGRLSPIYRARN